jgi:predicted negative regulator of RcsB-dependent stress response
MAKTTRKELLNPQDEFITTTSATVKWIKENPSRFAIIVTIVLAVFASGIGFYHWKTSREDSAMLAYSNTSKSSQGTLDVLQTYGDTNAGKLAKLRLARMSYNENNPKMASDYARGFV